MMALLAGGLNVLRNADAGTCRIGSDAETAPMDHPKFYQFDIDTTAVTEVWRRGSVIKSWLLDLTAAALCCTPSLDEYTGRVSRLRRGPLATGRGSPDQLPTIGSPDVPTKPHTSLRCATWAPVLSRENGYGPDQATGGIALSCPPQPSTTTGRSSPPAPGS